MKNLAKAVVNVMKSVNGVVKAATVGSGSYSYKGVNDKDVKNAYKKAMTENGLCILPVDIQEETDINRFVDSYGKNKVSILTKVKTKYLLLHESGESQEIAGYGHGIDTGDKGAGKATTYALKYALLYTFLTPTGQIDDADKTHSNDIEAPPVKKAAPKSKEKTAFDKTTFGMHKGTVQAYLNKGESHEEVKTRLLKSFTTITDDVMKEIKKMKPQTANAAT